MNRLFRVLHRWKCRTAAQKLALDALRRFDDDSARWTGLFLWHVEPYFRGVDAPEGEFRDFANHVLYPESNWGGAARLARKWYWNTVEALRSRDWPEAAYAAGVLARYATFATSPLRTSHDETVLALRRPADWCVFRLYDGLIAGEQAARPVSTATGDDWLERLLTNEAKSAQRHLSTVTARFDLEAVSRKPAALDDEVRMIFATQMSRSAATLGAVLMRAIAESAATPPRYPVAAAGLLALPSLPLFWLTRGGRQRRERRAVLAMCREFRKEGRVETTLPEDARSVREAFEIEVLKKSTRTVAADAPLPPRDARPARSNERKAPAEAAPRRRDEPSLAQRASDTLKSLQSPPKNNPIPSANKTAGAGRPSLSPASPVAAAPSVGARHSGRLEAAGVKTVGDLLAADPETLSASLHPHATSADIDSWQDEARLCCEVAGLAPAESQLLVACGVTGPDDLAALSPVELWELVVPVAESPDGRRLLHGGPAPDLDAVTRWIDAACRVRQAA